MASKKRSGHRSSKKKVGRPKGSYKATDKSVSLRGGKSRTIYTGPSGTYIKTPSGKYRKYTTRSKRK